MSVIDENNSLLSGEVVGASPPVDSSDGSWSENGYTIWGVFKRMLDYLPPCFNMDPLKELAFVISSPTQQILFTIEGFFFQLWVGGSFTPALSVDLRFYTIGDLVSMLNGLSLDLEVTEVAFSDKSALRLLPTANDSSGRVYIFTNTTWALMGAMALELMDAQVALRECIRQMTIVGATGIIQDYWGSFANVLRNAGEDDTLYGQRVLVEVKAPKTNNMALEIIINIVMGVDVSVIDLGVVSALNVMYMNDISTPIQNPSYCLWDYSTPAMYFSSSFGVVLNGMTIEDLSSEQLSQLEGLLLDYKAAGISPAIVWKGSASGNSAYQAFGNWALYFV